MNYQFRFSRGITIMMNKFIAALIISLFCLEARAWRESNGGNGIISEASLIADSVIDEIWRIPALVKIYTKKPFTIEAQPNLTLNGKPVDAYTTTDHSVGTNTIFINMTTWKGLTFPQKRLLMLHEVTHFMYKVDQNYEISKVVAVKLADYYEYQVKFPDSDFPLDDAVISSVEKCNKHHFIRAYGLIDELQHVLQPNNQTIADYVQSSSCSLIKEHVKTISN